ncbi:unnamed protein product [Rhizoctonia solani]|uniref:Uncharacterized protein n=1 Tax=Rhizoctonia solani TaxID=456999 RepID=A0A8H3DQ48_9AGAM
MARLQPAVVRVADLIPPVVAVGLVLPGGGFNRQVCYELFQTALGAPNQTLAPHNLVAHGHMLVPGPTFASPLLRSLHG